MAHYLYSSTLAENDFTDETRKLIYLKNYLDDSKRIDRDIGENFPIELFGSSDEDLKISGVKTLLESFDSLAKEKYDFVEKFRGVTFDEINDKRQMVLTFPSQDITAHGIYTFTTDFLNQFQMTKYADYCRDHNYEDLISSNITTLLERNADVKKQFRLLRDKDNSWGIRALTSDSYKNYDNGPVLYLALLAMHKYATQKSIFFRIKNSYISDSFMYVFFEQPNPTAIPNVGNVFLGLSVSNGEIRNYKFRVELRYRIVTPDNKSLAAIYDTPLFSIVHRSTISNINEQLNRFIHLDQYENSVINFITRLNTTEVLSEDSTYFLINDFIKNIDQCSDISKKTKDEFKKLETEHLIGNTISLINFFDKAQTIKTDMDEKVFVERIFHRVISDLVNHDRN